jgi:hypothetical protein
MDFSNGGGGGERGGLILFAFYLYFAPATVPEQKHLMYCTCMYICRNINNFFTIFCGSLDVYPLLFEYYIT